VLDILGWGNKLIFIYIPQDDDRIKDKNPKDNPDAFGNALKK